MSAFQQRAEPASHPLYVDDLLALSCLSPRDLAHELGVSVRVTPKI